MELILLDVSYFQVKCFHMILEDNQVQERRGNTKTIAYAVSKEVRWQICLKLQLLSSKNRNSTVGFIFLTPGLIVHSRSLCLSSSPSLLRPLHSSTLLPSLTLSSCVYFFLSVKYILLFQNLLNTFLLSKSKWLAWNKNQALTRLNYKNN